MDPLRFLTTVCVGGSGTELIPSLGLQLWLDATDASTITIVTGVSQWADKSGKGNTVVQATEALQPTYETNVQNGCSVVRFNGSSQYMAKTSPTNLVGLSNMTCFVVSIADTDVSTDTLVGCFETQGNQRSWVIIRANGDPRRWFFTSSDGTNSTGDARVATGTGGWGLTTCTLTTDDQSITFKGVTGTDTTITLPTFNGTSPLYIGINDPVDGSYWDGDIGEVIFYNRLLSASEIAQVQGYLQRKWNIT